MTLYKFVQLPSTLVHLGPLALIMALTNLTNLTTRSHRGWHFLSLSIVRKILSWWGCGHLARIWSAHTHLIADIDRFESLDLLRVAFNKVKVVFYQLLFYIIQILLWGWKAVCFSFFPLICRRFHGYGWSFVSVKYGAVGFDWNMHRKTHLLLLLLLPLPLHQLVLLFFTLFVIVVFLVVGEGGLFINIYIISIVKSLFVYSSDCWT